MHLSVINIDYVMQFSAIFTLQLCLKQGQNLDWTVCLNRDAPCCVEFAAVNSCKCWWITWIISFWECVNTVRHWAHTERHKVCPSWGLFYCTLVGSCDFCWERFGFIQDFFFLQRKTQDKARWEVKTVGLTSSSHVLTGPDWLEADKGDLHRQYKTHDVKSAVGCREKRNKRGWRTRREKQLN